MPSRKKAKGRARRAAAKSSRSNSSSEVDDLERNISALSLQDENKKCDHGYPSHLPDNHVCFKFLEGLKSSDCLASSFDDRLQRRPDLVRDNDNRQTLVDICVATATGYLLTRDLDQDLSAIRCEVL